MQEQLIIIDGGSVALDLTRADIAHIYPTRVHDGIRIHEVWLFIDDKGKGERQVLKVIHRSTLSARKPRWGSDSVTLHTIYGYDPDKNCWGPSERRSEMDIDWKNGQRLISEVQQFAQANLVEYRNGPHWYRRTR